MFGIEQYLKQEGMADCYFSPVIHRSFNGGGKTMSYARQGARYFLIHSITISTIAVAPLGELKLNGFNIVTYLPNVTMNNTNYILHVHKGTDLIWTNTDVNAFVTIHFQWMRPTKDI